MISSYEKLHKAWSWTAFSSFKPLTGVVPSVPFEALPTIAGRARCLLPNRSEDEIIGAANLIDGVIETYYESVRGQVIVDLLQQYPDPQGILKKEFLDSNDIKELDRRQDDIEELLWGGWIPGLNLEVPFVPTRRDVPDFESLKLVERYLHYQEMAFKDGMASEYFGALALRYIEDTIETISHFGVITALDSENGDKSASEDENKHPSSSIVLAAQPFAYAVDAVSYGEHLSHLAKLGIPSVSDPRSMQDLAAVEAKRLLSEMSKRGAEVRHSEHRQLGQDIESWYLEHHSEFKSQNAAAEFVIRKIAPVAFVTARKYISSAAKKIEPSCKP